MTMDGDGLGGLVALIFGAMALMVVVGGGAGWALGWLVGRGLRLSETRRTGVSVGFAALGLLLSVVVASATFFERTWSPPPVLTLSVPQGFDRRFALLLDDPAGVQKLTGGKTLLPLTARSATVRLPRSGVARVNGLAEFTNHGEVVIVWSDGASTDSIGRGPAHEGIGASSYLIAAREPGHPDEPAPDTDFIYNHDLFRAWLARQEALE
jgi:hypothetical protein